MADDNSVKARKQTTESRDCLVEEGYRESKTTNKPKIRLEPGSPEWLRYWSLVFRRMK